MAHFAKIGLNSKVIAVHSVVNEVLNDSNGIQREDIGIDFLTQLHGWAIWKQTSYNTKGGVHSSGGTPLRKNFAGIGYTYDEDRDAFIPPKPFNSWILNEDTCLWNAPVARPQDDNIYSWNESTLTWDIVEV
jgi:hypothetical protein